MIPMGVPLLPPAEKLLPYLKRIDESRWYTNCGPLVREYEERMSQLFNCYVCATSSCTSGLTAALIAMDDPFEEMSVPSWTFAATVNAVKAAGFEPDFVDTNELTWQTPSYVTTAPFGAPITDTECVVDAAAAFDAYALGMGKIGAKPVVISTHATKCFSTGEGGLVLSTDRELIQETHNIINHGFNDEREIKFAGINGKMSEHHAAVGLAELDNWAWKRNKWLELKRKYVTVFEDIVHTTPLSSLSWVGPTFAVRLVGKDGDEVRAKLQEKGIASRKIWGDGVHKYFAYDGIERAKMPVTEMLAREVVFLPYSIDIPDKDLDHIITTLREILE